MKRFYILSILPNFIKFLNANFSFLGAKLLLFSLLIFFSKELVAQTNPSTGYAKLNVKHYAYRGEVALTNDHTVVELQNLAEGETYQIIARPRYKEDNCPLSVSLDGSEFGETVELIAGKENKVWVKKGCKNELAASISVGCLTCKRDKSWIKSISESSIVTTPSVPVDSLVRYHFVNGNCYDVENVTSLGNSAQIGTFSNGTSSISIEDGIVLATGPTTIVEGPNNQEGAGVNISGGPTADTELGSISTGPLYNVAAIEFDFTPTTDTVLFDYVFSSEEYCEYVNSQFNDVFG
ncbi:MAG TPA: hypothetical protein ENK85_03995, partial [Saprospiraceae bacterium]|nr:hypothetical protein [Saprospiraceae bacterium]